MKLFVLIASFLISSSKSQELQPVNDTCTVQEIEAFQDSLELTHKYYGPWGKHDYNETLSISPYTYHFGYPVPVKDINNKLIYVSTSMNQLAAVRLDFQDDDKSCITKLFKISDSVVDRKVSSLGNGKVIVALKNANLTLVNSITSSSKVLSSAWKVAIIDPKDCTHRNFTLTDTNTIADILPHKNTFDVVKHVEIKHGHKDLARVDRYNDEGKLIESFLVPSLDEEVFLKIFPVKEYSHAEGFDALVHSKKTNILMVKRLSGNFELERSSQLSTGRDRVYEKNSFSVGHDRFSYCYFGSAERTSMKCMIENYVLNKTSSMKMYDLDLKLGDAIVKNLPNGRTVLVYTMIDQDQSRYVDILHLDENGKSESLRLGKTPEYSIESYFFAMNNGSYCVAFTNSQSIMSKCIIPSSL